MRVVLWICWGAAMLAMTGLGALGWAGLMLYFVVGYGSGVLLHRTMVKEMERNEDEFQSRDG